MGVQQISEKQGKRKIGIKSVEHQADVAIDGNRRIVRPGRPRRPFVI
jgi:hypothetical protein